MHAVAGVRPAAPPGTDAPTPPSGAVCYLAFDFHAVPPPPHLVLSGHAASLTPY